MWEGFIKESKKFMSYDNMSWKEKFFFWLHFPKAYYIFNGLMKKDRGE